MNGLFNAVLLAAARFLSTPILRIVVVCLKMGCDFFVGARKPASPMKREAGSLNLGGRDSFRLWEKEPHTGANQVLAQSTVLVCIELGARILEEMILDKRADFGREKVI